MTESAKTTANQPARLARSTGPDAVAAIRASSSISANKLAHVLIIDHDRDCIDALEMLLDDMPGVASVASAPSAAAAIATFDARDALDAFGRSARRPDIILIDPQVRVDRIASLQATLRALRQRLPDSAIVLLSVYPGSTNRALAGLVDRSIQKDTSYRELRALIAELVNENEPAIACPAAG